MEYKENWQNYFINSTAKQNEEGKKERTKNK